MAIPSSGALSLQDIETEFGGTGGISLSEYYSGGSYVATGALADGGVIPSSGQISIGDFYGGEWGTPSPASSLFTGGTSTIIGQYDDKNWANVSGMTVESEAAYAYVNDLYLNPTGARYAKYLKLNNPNDFVIPAAATIDDVELQCRVYGHSDDGTTMTGRIGFYNVGSGGGWSLNTISTTSYSRTSAQESQATLRGVLDGTNWPYCRVEATSFGNPDEYFDYRLYWAKLIVTWSW